MGVKEGKVEVKEGRKEGRKNGRELKIMREGWKRMEDNEGSVEDNGR